ncbi:thiazole synthase [Sinorhizobium meliloti]|uniref:thiazole synthase n=1 Tax=Rhizobium meliloti TaxID=382 RepID=UPI00066A687C|nr:thiazole synthase [Sinorhizobium meliloti]RVH76055.1 thiazole synthase [Sinorhizobium meliloti]RVK93806.1 thiazole synthase [Sinorhizobium meliloti]RVM20859.1 thiazole synthase [Sinorhizobium meliloti]RVM85809.1 thiazole synthase [Sinorhizobium meliloti]RVN02492.1 thiazole synthase [Sinorhizobium meliloti]
MKVQWQVTGGRSGGTFFEMIRALGVRILTNTAGCHSVAEAVLTARIARELFATDWIKLEVIGNHDTLQPDVFGPVEAARILVSEGFEVSRYTSVLPDRRQRRVDCPAGTPRRQAGAVAHQGSSGD